MKLYPQRQNGTKALVALRFVRGKPRIPDWIISFGTAPLAANTLNTLNSYGGVANPHVTGLTTAAATCARTFHTFPNPVVLILLLFNLH